ncbi:DNA-directed RNA polymerase sigma-70 factor [Hallella multisaccharivorax DSM 17128]|nr:sigma-70 family RNA polymerase sigma factor [Hallella multisaccharivorax]GJG29488.1 DNA-directed RNA polymerase sigma-70 factor [Hallella multisaccharivorax DSM 17128]
MNQEQHILQMFAQGDERAMDMLYSVYAGYLTGVCSRYVPQYDDLCDVLQEALVKIFTSISMFRYQGVGSLKAWLTRVVINEALIFLRDRKKMRFVDDDREIPEQPEEQPDESALNEDMVAAAIQVLPDGYRTVFNLYAIEGKSHKEIAKILNIKPDTSASQYHRAKNMLARLLKEMERKEGQR